MKAIEIKMLFADTKLNKALLLELEAKYKPLLIQESKCEYFKR